MSESLEDRPNEAMPGSDTGQTHERSPGSMLRDARLRREHTVETLAETTKLPKKTIVALENNDFEALSEPVFARGYYRQCAKVLSVPPERFIDAYNALTGETGGSSARPRSVGVVPEDVTPQGRRALGVVLLVLLLLIVVGVLFLVWPYLTLPGQKGAGADSGESSTATISPRNERGSPAGRSATLGAPAENSTSASHKTESTSTTSGGTRIATGGTPDIAGNPPSGGPARSGRSKSGQDNGTTREPSAGMGAAQPKNDSASDPSKVSSNENASENAGAPADRLQLTFDKRSWVSVTDSTHKRLISGIYASGDTKALTGKPPYKISLGRAAAVKVKMGGKPVDVASNTESDGTAHFRVDVRGG